ncbi:MAG: hypothetical protein IT168_21645 [Bryobacterales bacterium]|nr:hypothetical protein [Bryobacterales bacterium]
MTTPIEWNAIETPAEPQPREAIKRSRPRVSAELFSIPLDNDSFIIYAPLRRAAFVANRSMVNFIDSLRHPELLTVDAAEANEEVLQFLRSLEIVDAGPEIRPPVGDFTGPPRPTALTLFLTTACNLRCTYCYASAGDRPATFMTIDTARRGIDFVIANAMEKRKPEIEITFHGGGEPTVHWKVMCAALAYARERCVGLGLSVKAYSATNGVLSPAQTEWIVANLQGLSVSFDGVPDAHDSNRLTVLGQASSSTVAQTLRALDAARFPYGLRVTVTPAHIARLPESLHYICSNFSPRQIMVEPAYNLGRWTEAPSAESQSFTDAFREAGAVARQFGHSLYFSAARVGLLTNHFCGVTQDAFALSPSGNVSACYEAFDEGGPFSDTFFYGAAQPDGGYSFNLPVLNNLRSQVVERRAFCEGCFAKWSCAGDCLHKGLSVNAVFNGSDRCHITRELTKDQILTKIEEAGGVFWHEGGLNNAQPDHTASDNCEVSA